MFTFGAPPRRRRPALTPMIDVVFLLLIFFMLASQFGRDGALQFSAAGGGGEYSGPPRLVSVAADGLSLNGRPVLLGELPVALQPMMRRPDDIVVLRPADGVGLQRLIDVAEALRSAGLTALAVVE
ncbi:MAG: biopolymer transporter ExbD [Pseudomonadota bacterium]